MSTEEQESCGEQCACRAHQINRRTFLTLGSAAIVGSALGAMPIMAGPLAPADPNQPVTDFAALIPPDKRLRPEWVASLFARGTPWVYTKKRNELRYIGMPVGGLTCGTVYLGGDGRLWNWDIFNENQEGVLPRTITWNGFGGTRAVKPRSGASYVVPHEEQSPFEQGFALKVGGKVLPLDASGWADIAFHGAYPLGSVRYSDPACPVAATLTAYSPFVPLQADDSGLPVTLCEFTLTNTGSVPVTAEIAGWLQNAARLHTGAATGGNRVNAVRPVAGATVIECAFVPDAPPAGAAPPPTDGDDGTMALMLLGHGTAKAAVAAATVFDAPASDTSQAGAGETLVAAITAPLKLAPGQSQTVTYALTWHFPNSGLNHQVKDAETGNYYAKRFADATAVAGYVAANYARLSRRTKLWRDTWYDSTLPYWFLDRTFGNTSVLATTTAHRFATGRFWGWEGVGCCGGTCTHVWHYAQAMGRLFPELERDVRERVDLGIALHPDGSIGFRGEGTGPAVDGQCGRILGTYREHQMSADSRFLKRVYPQVKRAMQYMIAHDSNSDGLIDGPQPNTLDGTWYGSIPWISTLYAAALRACEEMATEMGDTESAALYHQKFVQSKNAIETQLFNGEYFFQLPDPAHTDTLGSYSGCGIDQVMGQGWAWQVGLGRILDREKTVTALKSLYKYNFAPDVGRFREKNTAGRPYALAGDAGLIMVTNPHDLPKPFGVQGWQFEYFNECMSGFEHQAGAHMIAEGLTLEGLAVERAIHDRYHAALRNPYNEIECSDHYSRTMATYGAFIAICGFEYHGPKGHLGFNPRITPEHFKAAFTAAEGWGTYAQQVEGRSFAASLLVQDGSLRLTTLTVAPPPGVAHSSVTATLNGKRLPVTHQGTDDGRLQVTLPEPALLLTGHLLRLHVGPARPA